VHQEQHQEQHHREQHQQQHQQQHHQQQPAPHLQRLHHHHIVAHVAASGQRAHRVGRLLPEVPGRGKGRHAGAVPAAAAAPPACSSGRRRRRRLLSAFS